MDRQGFNDAFRNIRGAERRAAAAEDATRHYHEVPSRGLLAGLRRRLARLFRRA